MTPMRFPVKMSPPVGQQNDAISLKVEKQQLEVEEVGKVLLVEPTTFFPREVVTVCSCFPEVDSRYSPQHFQKSQNPPQKV